MKTASLEEKEKAAPPVEVDEEEDTQSEEEKRFKEMTDENEEFLSLYHKFKYGGTLPLEAVGGPDAKDYPPDAEDRYNADCRAFLETGKLASGHAMYKDDPHKYQRADLTAKIAELELDIETAKYRREYDRLDFLQSNLQWARRDLRELPPMPVMEYAQDYDRQDHKIGIDRYFKGEHDAPDNERTIEDAGTFMSQHMDNSRAKTLYLPKETERGSGSILPATPGNVIKFGDLPPDVLRQVKEAVRVCRDQTPEGRFKVAWNVLNRTGHWATGEASPVNAKPEESTDWDEETPKRNPRDPDQMTQPEFEKWRTKSQAKQKSKGWIGTFEDKTKNKKKGQRKNWNWAPPQ